MKYSKRSVTIITLRWKGVRDVASFGLGGATAPLIFFFLNIIIYMCVLILAILFYKITFFSFKQYH